MTARIREVIAEIQSHLDSNLTDPVTRRPSSERWIFDHFPQFDNASLPRIGLHRGDKSHSPIGINAGAKMMEDADILATVIVRQGSSFDFDDDGTNEPAEDVLDYLTRRVKEEVEENQSVWEALSGVQYVIPHPNLTSLTNRPSGKNIMLETLPLLTKIIRS